MSFHISQMILNSVAKGFPYKNGDFKNVMRNIKRFWLSVEFSFTALAYSPYSVHPYKRPLDFSQLYETDWKDTLSTENGPRGVWNSCSLIQSKQISLLCQQRSSGPYKPARNQQMFMSGWMIRTSCLNWCVFMEF